MKAFFLFTFIILMSNFAYSKANLPVLICTSPYKISGWDSSNTYAKLTFTAYIKDKLTLSKAEVSGAFFSDVGELTTEVNPKYEHLRFGPLEDAWHWFFILLPQDFVNRNKIFTTQMQIYNEEHPYAPIYEDINCFVKVN